MIDSKVLESLMIDDNSLSIANEGLLSIMKQRKVEKENRDKEYREWLNNCNKIFGSLLKPELTKILNQIKNKYQKDKLPWKISLYYIINDACIEINIFEDEWCMNEYDEKYNPSAQKAFDQCYKAIKDFCNKFSNTGKYVSMNFDADVIENNVISIEIDMA